MRTFTLLLLLVAGVAGAQPGPTNCRSAAHACSGTNFTSWNTTGPAFQGNVTNGQYVLKNGSAWGITTGSGGATMSFQVLSGAPLQINGVGGEIDIILNWPLLHLGVTSGSVAFGSNTGAWWDFGGGANDRMRSDGTNIVSDTDFLPNGDGVKALGGGASGWLKGYYTRGIVLGSSATWSQTPLSNTTQELSQIFFNASSGAPTYRNSSRSNNELGGEKDWAFEKRALRIDVGISNTNCPVGAPSIRGTGAAAVTLACTDAAAATSATVDSEPMRFSTTTAADAAVSFINLSGDVTTLQLGPRFKQHVALSSLSNVRAWVALVPTATSLSGVDTGAISVIGFRFSTAAGDATWKACTGNAAAVTCVDTGIGPQANRDIELEIDCREVAACRFLIDGTFYASQTTPANMPATSTTLGLRLLVQAAGAAAVKSLGVGRGALETN